MKTVTKTGSKEEKAINDVIWSVWPELDEETRKFIYASEEELDRSAYEKKSYEDRVIEAEGPVNGYITILEKELDILTERLNSLVDYVQSAEEWKSWATQEYVVSRKKLAERFSELV